MKSKVNLSYLFYALITLVLLAASSASFAGHADDTTRAFRGTMACGANHFRRLNGTERQFSAWAFRNFDDRQTIFVDRIRIYDATGQLRADYAGTALPTFSLGDLGGTDNALEPYQSATLLSSDMFGDHNFPHAERPLQMIVDWSASGRVLLLSLSHNRLVRDRIKDPVSGAVTLGDERSRGINSCRHIRVGRGWR